MRLGIMQPYFLPYIGYWQLMAAVDSFVVYDNIQYAKKGWINRNRFLRDGRDAYFTVPLKHASAYASIVDREVAPDFDRDRMLRVLTAAYRRAPQFAEVYPVIEGIVRAPFTNLFEYVHHSLLEMARFLEIRTPMVISSTIAIDHSLTSQDKVLAICRAMGATRYLNPAGGHALYAGAAFAAAGIRLEFLHARPREYAQFGAAFVSNLSILDVIMFNTRDAVREMLREADVVPAV